MAEGLPTASDLSRRLRTARIEAALTGTANALLLGGTGIAAVACFVAEARGALNPGTWMWVLGSGMIVLAGKVALDLADRAGDDRLWRNLLATDFGTTMREDAAVTTQARMAIEFRVRLALAEARAGRAARARVAALMPRLDGWLDGIVRLARQVSVLRGEARFQSGLALRSRQRRVQIEGSGQSAQHAATAAALEDHVAAAEGFARFAEDGLLRLEQAVGAFGAAASQLVLELSRDGADAGHGGLDARIGQEVAAVEVQLARIGQLTPPPPPPS